MQRKKKVTLAVIVAAIVLLVFAAVAIAQSVFPDVDENNVHKEGIDWAAERGIVKGFTNGNFGPFDPILRGQAATMFKRYDDFRMEAVEARRGCPDCHVPGSPFTLAQEARLNAANHPTLADDAGFDTCISCHAPAAGGGGLAAPLSLRDIVHPAHMGSKIFAWELMGNCFSCHNVNSQGVFQILPQNVATDAKGVPDVVPIPGAVDPQRPGGTTTTTVPSTTTTSVPSTTSTTATTSTTIEDNPNSQD